MDSQINLDGLLFHTSCAKCEDCKCQITLANFVKSKSGEETSLLCKTHSIKRFNEGGGKVISKIAPQVEEIPPVPPPAEPPRPLTPPPPAKPVTISGDHPGEAPPMKLLLHPCGPGGIFLDVYCTLDNIPQQQQDNDLSGLTAAAAAAAEEFPPVPPTTDCVDVAGEVDTTLVTTETDDDDGAITSLTRRPQVPVARVELYLGSVEAGPDGFVSFDDLRKTFVNKFASQGDFWKQGIVTYHCTAFVIPSNQVVSKEDLLNGSYSNHADATGDKRESAMCVKTLDIQETASGDIEPKFMDTGVDVVEFSFVNKDMPVADATFSGEFVKDGRRYPVLRTTDSEGVAMLALPPGVVKGNVTTKDKAQLAVSHNIQPRPEILPIDDQPRKCHGAAVVNTITQSVNLTDLRKFDETRPMILLGDVSGSMSGCNIELLRITMKNFFLKSVAKRVPIALAAWNNDTNFCKRPGENQPCFFEENDIEHVTAWISRLSAGGGTNVKQVLLAATSALPLLADIHVMCDGDITPFTVNYDDNDPDSWLSFRCRYPNIKFHFVAVDKGASHEDMAVMASVGGGSFTSANN